MINVNKSSRYQWKFGSRISDIELYQLNECYELSKLNEKTAIDEVLKVYGQLQLNAARMAALARNAPKLKKEQSKIGSSTVYFASFGVTL